MPKVDATVLNYFIQSYLDDKEANRGFYAFAANTYSKITGSVDSGQIHLEIKKLRLLIRELNQNDTKIVEILKTLGSKGRDAQLTKADSSKPSAFCQALYAAISYVFITLAEQPLDNVGMLNAIAREVADLQLRKAKIIKEFDEMNPVSISTSNVELNKIICDLASLGQPKELLLSQRINQLYGAVEMPSATSFNTTNHYITGLPLILHTRIYMHDYLKNVRNISFVEFSRKAREEVGSLTSLSPPNGSPASLPSLRSVSDASDDASGSQSPSSKRSKDERKGNGNATPPPSTSPDSSPSSSHSVFSSSQSSLTAFALMREEAGKGRHKTDESGNRIKSIDQTESQVPKLT